MRLHFLDSAVIANSKMDYSLFHSLHRSRAVNLIVDSFRTITFIYTTLYANKGRKKRKNKVGTFTAIFTVGYPSSCEHRPTRFNLRSATKKGLLFDASF